MVNGLIGVKRGMTQLFDENDNLVPVTVLEVGPCKVLQVKTIEKDGYEAVQLGFGENSKLASKKSVAERFKKLGLTPLRNLKEFDLEKQGEFPELSAEITVEMLAEVKRVNVKSKSKGRGFQGVIKRHGFHGGRKTHGSHFHRAPGSIGMCAWPGEVPKGKKMPGRMGGEYKTVKNLEVVRVDADRNLVFVKGSVPGAKSDLIYVYKA